MEKEVDACLARLRADRLDLLQLHWWDFGDPRYLDVLHYLAELKDRGGYAWVGRCVAFALHLLASAYDPADPPTPVNTQARSGTWA